MTTHRVFNQVMAGSVRCLTERTVRPMNGSAIQHLMKGIEQKVCNFSFIHLNWAAFINYVTLHERRRQTLR